MSPFQMAMAALELAQNLMISAKASGLTDEELQALRDRRDALNEEWSDLAPTANPPQA